MDKTAESSLCVVTAATEDYARSLYQLLRNAERRRLNSEHHWIAFDIGMRKATRAKLNSRFPWCEFRIMDFSRLPGHVQPKANTYAWKVYIIAAIFKEWRGLVLWLDSASLIKTDFQYLISRTRQLGVYTLRGQSAIYWRCLPQILEKLSFPAEFYDKREHVAGIIGFDTDRAVVRRLVGEWKKLAGSAIYMTARTPIHNPEQALLTILLYSYEAEGLLTLNAEDIDISSPKPVSWASSRNIVANRFPTWTDIFWRAYFATYKELDQTILRFKLWYGRRIKGLHRWSKENFSTFAVFPVQTKAEIARRILAPKLSYFADPFSFHWQGRTYLFAEQFRYLENRARIVCQELKQDGAWGACEPVLQPDYHVSFPFVFGHGQKIYMIPESCENKSVDLYVAEEFPHRWHLARRILYGVDAADSVIFHHNNLWWLITSLRKGGLRNRYLAIFSSRSLTGKSWRAHPINDEFRYANENHGFGRNAGSIIRTGRKIYRPMQANRQYYGEALQLMLIEELSATRYQETALAPEGWPNLPYLKDAGHHYCSGDLTVYDRRDRLPFFRPIRKTKRY